MAGATTAVGGPAVAGPPLAMTVVGDPLGPRLVAGTVDGRVVVYDLETFAVLTLWQAHDDRIIAVGPGGMRALGSFVTVGELGEISRWSIDGTLLGRRRFASPAAPIVAAAVQLADGEWPLVLWASGTGDVTATNVETGTETVAFDGGAGWDGYGSSESALEQASRAGVWMAIGVASSGAGIVRAAVAADGRVAFTGLASPSEVAPPSAAIRARAIAVRNDRGGSVVAIGHEDGSIRIWSEGGDPATTARITGHTDWVRSLVWVERTGGPVLVSGSDDGTIRVWRDGEPAVVVARHAASIRTMTTATRPDGTAVVVTGGTDGVLRVWDVATGEEQGQVQAHEGWVQSVATLATAPERIASVGNDGVVRVFSSDGTPQAAQTIAGSRLRAVVGIGNDGSAAVAVAQEDGTIVAGEPIPGPTGAQPAPLARVRHIEEEGVLTLLALPGVPDRPWTDDGTWLVIGGRRALYGLRALDEQEPWEQRQPASTRAIVATRIVPFDPDSFVEHGIAAAGDEGVVRVWDSMFQPLVREHRVSERPLWALAMIDDGLLACFGDDREIHLIDPGSGVARPTFAGHQGRGRALATVERDGRRLLVSAATDGSVRLWDPDRVDGAPVDRWPRLPEPPVIDVTRVGGDDPARVDRLERAAIAAALATQLQHWRADPERKDDVLPVLIDAPWGVGKSSYVNFLVDGLKEPVQSEDGSPKFEPWLVADRPFDAWRESQIGAAWWSLLNHARRVVSPHDAGWWRRVSFSMRGFWNRASHAHRGTAVFLALSIVVLVLAGLWAAGRLSFGASDGSDGSGAASPTATATTVAAPATTVVPATSAPPVAAAQDGAGDGDGAALLEDLAGVAGSATTIITFTGLLLAAWFALVRVGLWYTPLGARLLQKTNENPMGAVMSHLCWLRQQADRPIVIVIDDLDRCRADYTVAILETLQTLVRQSDDLLDRRPEPGQRGYPQPLAFVVAADSAWLRSAIEQHYEKFVKDVGRPGRSLGWLFLDKLFPIRVRLLDVDQRVVQRFTRGVLDVPGARWGDEPAPSVDGGDVLPAPGPADGRDLEQSVRDASTMAEKETIIRSAPEERQPELRVVAAWTSLSSGAVLEATHLLAEHLDRIARIGNPRTIKRFRNAYILNRFSAAGLPDADTIVSWTLIDVQWPDLAERLRLEPDLVDSIHRGTIRADDPMVLLLKHDDVRTAVGSLTAEKLRTMLRLQPHSGSLDEAASAAGR